MTTVREGLTAELFVPGRLCLLGEHTDWAGAYRSAAPELAPGRCLVTGTDQGLHATASPGTDEFEISTVGPDGVEVGSERLPLVPELLDAAAQAGGFFSYAAGTAAEVVRRHDVRGVRIHVTAADLPVGKGLSSSAAACVLVARAFDRVWVIGLSTREEMELAWAGERRTGSECGMMDQVCAFGRATVLLTFDGDDFHIESAAPGAPIHLLLVDVGGRKNTRHILCSLNACFPATPGRVAAGVREALGPRNVGLVDRGTAAVRAGDAAALGAVMAEAQATFDRLVAPACPEELTAPRLHAVLAHPAVGELGFGGKGVGSQGDGAAQIVCRGEAEREELARRLEKEMGVRTLPLTMRPPEAD
jgi:galactokinase